MNLQERHHDEPASGNIEAVLWDYDNTLRLTESVALGHACKLLNSWLSERGVSSDDLYQEAAFAETFVGTTFHEIVRRAAENHLVSVSDNEISQLADRERREVIPHLQAHSQEMPYAELALRGLQELQVMNAVVSSSHPERLKACMQAANQVDLVRGVFSVQDPDQPTEPKPAPRIYQKAASILGVSVERCLAVEDSPTGVKSAVGAGIKTIGFIGPYPIERRDDMKDKLLQAGASWVIAELSLVPLIVKAINEGSAALLDRLYGRQ